MSVRRKCTTFLLMVIAQVTTECKGECQLYRCRENYNDFSTIIPRLIYTVLVHEPWPVPYLFAPISSTIEISCTTISDSPYWVIDLEGDAVTTHLQFSTRREKLNDHGVYELPRIETSGMPPTHTLRLLINDTVGNNLSLIHI